MDTGQLFLDSVVNRFNEYKKLAEKTFDQLSDEDMHRKPNEFCNSVAVIVQHLHGNMCSRWTNFLTEDGEKPWRKRDAEFEAQLLTKEQVLKLWQEGWSVLLDTLALLTPADLSRTVTIRNQPLLVLDAVNRQLAHYSSHVGQIILLGKWIKGEDWQTLSIPLHGSTAFNEKMMGKNYK